MTDPLDLSGVHTYPLAGRHSKVSLADFGRPHPAGGSLAGFLDSLPRVLGAESLRALAGEVLRARARGKPIVWGVGAHVLKVGLSPLLVDLMERGLLTGLALNGAGIVHDFELAVAGQTSEDVEDALGAGSFGMARETGDFLNRATAEGVAAGQGLGLAVGTAIARARLRFRKTSILAAAARTGIPATVHVAIGTDIIHMHPGADGAAIGEGSLRDFRLLAGVVARLAGGVYVNLGSAVVLPEVFVKALNLARNVGHPVRDLTTVDMDFIRQYRPGVNVVARPTAAGGLGIRLIGHHEIMFPLLWAAAEEALARRR
jgi:hypothetical protein